MAKTSYKSPSIKQEYLRERRRISRAIKKLEKEGRIVNYDLPQIPKKVTEASVRKLHKITPKYLRSKSSVYSKEEGEFVTGWKANAIINERKRQEKIEKKEREKTKQYEKQTPSKDNEDGDIFYPPTEIDFPDIDTPEIEVPEDYFTDEVPEDYFADTETGEELFYVDPDTGDIVPKEPEDADYRDDSFTEEAPEKTKDKDDDYYPDEGGIILENIRQAFENFIPPDNTRRHRNLKEEKTNDVNVATRLLNDAIDKFGEAEVARRLEASADTIWGIIETIMYSAYREQVEAAMLDYRNLLYGEKANASEAMELDEMLDYYDALF